MPTYTREQKIAQSADRHLAVTAGAGAGKTSVLVQRFVHLLFDDSIRADVRQITAITFTRKAAAEMHHRISQEIEKLLADPTKKHQWGRIKAVRERFSSANISTIHSFCARLLREFPIEAGVNPNFTELEEHEGTLIKEHAIMDTLEAWFEEKEEGKGKKAKGKKIANTATSEIASEIADTEPDKAEIPDEADEKQVAARRVWMLFGKETLLNMLKTLLQNAERFNELDVLYRKHSIEALLKMSEELFVTRFLTKTEEYISTLDAALGALDFNAFTKTTRPKLEDLSSTLAIIKKQVQSLTTPSPEAPSNQVTKQPSNQALTWRNAQDLWNRIATTVLVNGAISRTKGTISGSSVRENTEKNFLDKERYLRLNYEANGHFLAINRMADVLPNHSHDHAMQEVVRILLDIAREAWMLVREEKERLGALDFDDLELKADVLLNNPEVCDKLCMNTRFLMIDEFQDTNELQYRIAKKIIRNLGQTSPQSEEISASGTNLFIVGDPKQSIYRFRGADVRVFTKAKRDIAALNRRLLAAGQLETSFRTGFGIITSAEQAEADGNIGLRATFRLLPEIAAFVNRVAGDQLRRTTTEFDVEYQEIVCGAANSTLQGTVTMLLARYPYKKNAQGNDNDENYLTAEQIDAVPNEEESALSDQNTEFIPEAQLLAEYLRAIAQGTTEKPVLVRSADGSPRAATYNDMMILVRSRSGMDDLLTALRRCDVPFTVIGGRGFYERQEILDVRSFLLFLQNANDDIALAAVLRSPFYAVSDTELYAISRTEVSASGGSSTSSLWERFNEYCSVEERHSAVKPSTQAFRAFTTLTNLLPLAAQLSIPTLVRTILEQTAWRGMIAADERFDQIEANLEKLLVLARKYENKGFRNLYDFAEELRRLALYAFNEGEADADASKNAVQIMTIHGAKGLEAPIVALYNTNAKSGGFDGGLSFDSALGMSFKMLRVREDGTMEYIPTPLYTLASEQDSLAEAAEIKRLLYVALTRPKDHLILSAKGRETANGGMKKAEGFLAMIQESLGAEERNLLHEPFLAKPQETLEILFGEGIIKRDVSFEIPIYRTREQFLAGQFPSEQFSSEQSSSEQVRSPHPDLLPEGEGERKEEGERKGEQEKVKIALMPLPPLLLGTLNSTVEGDFYSASQLRLFMQNPDEYERLYRLGLPPADDEGFFIGSAAGTEDDSDGTLGTTAGESIHAVLQHLPLWMSAVGEVLPSEFQRTIDRILPSTQRIFTPTLHARLQRETQAVAATPLVKRYAEALLGAKYEYPVTMPIDHDFLIGTMDVLVQTPSGALEIWDWKTNRVGSVRDMDRLLGEYRLQLELYAYIASFLAPEQHTFTTRLLFTRRASQTAHDEEWTRTLECTRLDVAAIETKVRQIIGNIRQRSYGLVSER
ncbi:MAG: UvrD-helicase domain-containing protein [Candidatus Kapabacteria bacterium]|jgi:ATP-dependent helicase/nuclease subunit A|nr:UvrD-helicase domain-containing protein [Candidatus Kapabacteria bacterium]